MINIRLKIDIISKSPKKILKISSKKASLKVFKSLTYLFILPIDMRSKLDIGSKNK